MLSDRIAVLRRGRILQTGTPQTLHDEPETAFVASFIGNCNLLHGRLHSLQPPEAGVIIGGAIVTARCRHRDVKPGQPITLAVRPQSLRLERASADQPLPPGQLTGVVTERLYVGAETHWTVCLPDGTSPRCRPSPGNTPNLGGRLTGSHQMAPVPGRRRQTGCCSRRRIPGVVPHCAGTSHVNCLRGQLEQPRPKHFKAGMPFQAVHPTAAATPDGSVWLPAKPPPPPRWYPSRRPAKRRLPDHLQHLWRSSTPTSQPPAPPERCRKHPVVPGQETTPQPAAPPAARHLANRLQV
jgi:hypothetical protein